MERNAEATGTPAARMAGSKPPTTPMTNAKTTPRTNKSGVMVNANATCEKVCKFIAPVVMPFTGSTARHPSAPPTNEISEA